MVGPVIRFSWKVSISVKFSPLIVVKPGVVPVYVEDVPVLLSKFPRTGVSVQVTSKRFTKVLAVLLYPDA